MIVIYCYVLDQVCKKESVKLMDYVLTMFQKEIVYHILSSRLAKYILLVSVESLLDGSLKF